MSFDIQTKYNETLDLLKAGKRPLIKLEEEELIFLAKKWQELNEQNAAEIKFYPILCIADHLTRSHEELVAPLVKTLEQREEVNLLVYTLSASFKVIIEDCQKKNERIPFSFLNALKKPLQHKDLEVLEWTLRVIDQLGPQGIFLKAETLGRKPGFMQKLNPKAKNIFELIGMLEKRWSPHE
ncbi:MAG: hypothetical protein CME60_10345 [Halobacteriovoraceae bacterium]|nr:hypothetical protein [Halobacteriovoraceae bacterium]